jgi:hypothetical protein
MDAVRSALEAPRHPFCLVAAFPALWLARGGKTGAYSGRPGATAAPGATACARDDQQAALVAGAGAGASNWRRQHGRGGLMAPRAQRACTATRHGRQGLRTGASAQRQRRTAAR